MGVADREERMKESPTGRFELAIERGMPAIKKVAPKFMTPERIVKIVVGAAMRNPKLLECEPVSVLKAVLESVAMGLEPGSPLGESYLVPFFNGKVRKLECILIPGYRGLVQLCYRSGMVSSINSGIVYIGDTFEFEDGYDPKLRHVPNFERELPDRFWPPDDEKLTADAEGMVVHGPNRFMMIKAVYACATLLNGAKVGRVLSRSEVERYRDRSMAKASGPWVTDWEPMARKTALKRLMPTMPMSIEPQTLGNINRALALDTAADTGSYEEIAGLFEPVEIPDLSDLAPAIVSGTESAKEAIRKVDTVKAANETAAELGKPDQKRMMAISDRLMAAGSEMDAKDFLDWCATSNYKTAEQIEERLQVIEQGAAKP